MLIIQGNVLINNLRLKIAVSHCSHRSSEFKNCFDITDDIDLFQYLEKKYFLHYLHSFQLIWIVNNNFMKNLGVSCLLKRTLFCRF